MLNRYTMLSIYYVFSNKCSIYRYNTMPNYKTKKAIENPRTALWSENSGKNQNVFFSNFVLLKWEQFTVVNNTVFSSSREFSSY